MIDIILSYIHNHPNCEYYNLNIIHYGSSPYMCKYKTYINSRNITNPSPVELIYSWKIQSYYSKCSKNYLDYSIK